jgi:hypothetical protein
MFKLFVITMTMMTMATNDMVVQKYAFVDI